MFLEQEAIKVSTEKEKGAWEKGRGRKRQTESIRRHTAVSGPNEEKKEKYL